MEQKTMKMPLAVRAVRIVEALIVLVVLVLAGCVMYMSMSCSVESGFANASAMVRREQALYGAVVKNGMCRNAGEVYIDPSEYANSADFIMALSRPIEEMYE